MCLIIFFLFELSHYVIYNNVCYCNNLFVDIKKEHILKIKNYNTYSSAYNILTKQKYILNMLILTAKLDTTIYIYLL